MSMLVHFLSVCWFPPLNLFFSFCMFGTERSFMLRSLPLVQWFLNEIRLYPLSYHLIQFLFSNCEADIVSSGQLLHLCD